MQREWHRPTNHPLLGPLHRADGLRARRPLARHASEERVHAGLVGTQPCSEGGVLGALYTSAGIGGLIGPPLAGTLIDSTGSFTPAIVMATALTFASFIVLTRLRT